MKSLHQEQSQTDRLYNLLSDYLPHRTDEIVRIIYGEGQRCLACGRKENLSLARVGARIYDVQKKYGVEIVGRKDKENKKLYWYSMQKIKVLEIPKEAKQAVLV